MTIEIKVPALPESVADATVAKWYKKQGEPVKRDENLVDIETDKVVLEVLATTNGVLQEIAKPQGTTVKAGEVLGQISEGAAEQKGAKQEPTGEQEAPAKQEPSAEEKLAMINGSIAEKKAPSTAEKEEKAASERETSSAAARVELSPSVRRMVAEHEVDVGDVAGTGKGGRITKEDVERHLKSVPTEAQAKPQRKTEAEVERLEKRVPLSRLRARIAERLLSAQQNMAILTTFNEINMQAVMDLRKRYKDQFEKAHEVRLGFMSFFVRAAVAALKRFPDVNAFIEGDEIVYHGYCDIGVAVSTERGLVVPILRDADNMSMGQIETKILEFSNKARDGKLTIEEITGGTFTISNGGVFGSLLSTPIVNPPQSAILGLHKIEDRPVVEQGQIIVRPMMYVALSYDHRIIDGKDSVQFLKAIKELIEDPARLLLNV
jgi:2-oxoglutarate dehydrogenase E2 component (dihydrolipoamide succinyltransferase)